MTAVGGGSFPGREALTICFAHVAYQLERRFGARDTGITHFENLASLDRVVGRRFTFIGFPLRIRAGTGSPVRAVAVLQ